MSTATVTRKARPAPPAPRLAGVEALQPDPPLRIRPIPAAEPRAARHLLEETGPGVSPLQGTLDLRYPRPAPAAMDDDEDLAPRTTVAEDLPGARAWASKFLVVAIEVSLGLRPAAQLGRMTTPEVQGLLIRRAALAARVERRRGSPPGGKRPFLRTVRLCEVRPGVYEVAAAVAVGDRVRAVALRIEDLDGRWRATALEIG